MAAMGEHNTGDKSSLEKCFKQKLDICQYMPCIKCYEINALEVCAMFRLMTTNADKKSQKIESPVISAKSANSYLKRYCLHFDSS